MTNTRHRALDVHPAPTTLVAGGIVFGESPRWHDGRLWLADIHAHRVLTVDSSGHARCICELDDRPGGLGFTPSGEMLVVSMLDRQLLSLRSGSPRAVADLSSLPGDFLLDMVVDGEGRAFIGARVDRSYRRDALHAAEGNDFILLVPPDAEPRIAAHGSASPNGMAVSAAGELLLVAETRAERISAYEIGSDGSLGPRRSWAELPGKHPDGICLDAEGGVWCGSPITHEFLRVEQGGKVTHAISTGSRWGVACALGGADRAVLYLVTTETSLENLTRLGSDRALDCTSASRSYVETAPAPVPGAGWP